MKNTKIESASIDKYESIKQFFDEMCEDINKELTKTLQNIKRADTRTTKKFQSKKFKSSMGAIYEKLLVKPEEDHEVKEDPKFSAVLAGLRELKPFTEKLAGPAFGDKGVSNSEIERYTKKLTVIKDFTQDKISAIENQQTILIACIEMQTAIQNATRQRVKSTDLKETMRDLFKQLPTLDHAEKNSVLLGELGKLEKVVKAVERMAPKTKLGEKKMASFRIIVKSVIESLALPQEAKAKAAAEAKALAEAKAQAAKAEKASAAASAAAGESSNAAEDQGSSRELEDVGSAEEANDKVEEPTQEDVNQGSAGGSSNVADGSATMAVAAVLATSAAATPPEAAEAEAEAAKAAKAAQAAAEGAAVDGSSGSKKLADKGFDKTLALVALVASAESLGSNSISNKKENANDEVEASIKEVMGQAIEAVQKGSGFGFFSKLVFGKDEKVQKLKEIKGRTLLEKGLEMSELKVFITELARPRETLGGFCQAKPAETNSYKTFVASLDENALSTIIKKIGPSKVEEGVEKERDNKTMLERQLKVLAENWVRSSMEQPSVDPTL